MGSRYGSNSDEYTRKKMNMNMDSGTGSHPTRISPRKFSEKIALLNKKERETNEKFEQIIKEVQATRSQQPNVTNGTVLSPKLIDELECMSRSDHRAANSDSLEEIERVYENLMKCVSQCDDQDIGINEKTNNSLTHLDQKMIKNLQYDRDNPDFNLRPSSENSSGHQAVSSTITTSCRDIPGVSYYSQNSNNFQNTNMNISDERELDQGIEYIPYEPPKDSFSGHSTLNMCVSSSYLPKLQPDNCVNSTDPVNACRARVVSFGSASRHKYSYANNNPIDQQTSGVRDQSHPYQLSQYQTQYLKEPSGDRSRQKSSSDPQLHVSPAPCMFPTVNLCKSDNRLATNEEIMDFDPNVQADIDCCTYQQRSQNSYCKTDYICHKRADNIIEPKSPQCSNQIHNQPNRVLQLSSSLNVDCSRNEVSTTSQFNQEQYSMCDTTNTQNELPGIKICAIEDEHSLPRTVMSDNNPTDGNNSGHSELETSLPDLSNLQFGNNSAGASPERDIYQKQWTQENNCTPFKPNNTEALITNPEVVNESCQAIDGSWASYECSRIENQDMDVAADHSVPPTTNQQQLNQARQTRLCWLANSHQQQQYSQQASNSGNHLSNSDCGFNVSNNHNQQGNLMICTSSELYNNIFRSRSHSSIDYLAKCNIAKRSQLHPGNMQQFEQHHTSQYCLENDQPVMNVRRIVELKAQGTSTSPLDSYSNLDSPQSEINSPGSSTTEQCDPTLVLSDTTQQEYYRTGTMTRGSCSTLVANETRLPHYNSAEAMEYQQNESRAFNPSVPVEMRQTLNQGCQTQGSQPLDKFASHSCLPTTASFSQGFYGSVISRPSDTAASQNKINSNGTNQQ